MIIFHWQSAELYPTSQDDDCTKFASYHLPSWTRSRSLSDASSKWNAYSTIAYVSLFGSKRQHWSTLLKKMCSGNWCIQSVEFEHRLADTDSRSKFLGGVFTTCLTFLHIYLLVTFCNLLVVIGRVVWTCNILQVVREGYWHTCVS